MRERFIDKKFSPDKMAMITWANSVLDRYQQLGHDMTVRQLHYQAVSANVYQNTQQNYSLLVDTISDARLAGLVDWGMISDRSRVTHHPDVWESLEQCLKHTTDSFKLDKWANQPYYLEVMIEKQALEGILLPICEKLEVRFTANKGYGSSSLMYEVGKRLQYAREGEGRHPVIVYCGDLDPSGWHMSADVERRLTLLSNGPVKVVRSALNIDQVHQYALPENPVKIGDARADAYIEQFGESSWELDALPPDKLEELVTDAVMKWRDPGKWEEALNQQDEAQEELQAFVDARNGND
jgi:hypothetical protein